MNSCKVPVNSHDVHTNIYNVPINTYNFPLNSHDVPVNTYPDVCIDWDDNVHQRNDLFQNSVFLTSK